MDAFAIYSREKHKEQVRKRKWRKRAQISTLLAHVEEIEMPEFDTMSKIVADLDLLSQKK